MKKIDKTKTKRGPNQDGFLVFYSAFYFLVMGLLTLGDLGAWILRKTLTDKRKSA